jgi:hypothetical protein
MNALYVVLLQLIYAVSVKILKVTRNSSARSVNTSGHLKSLFLKRNTLLIAALSVVMLYPRINAGKIS